MKLVNLTVGHEFTWGLGSEFELFGGTHEMFLTATVSGSVKLTGSNPSSVPTSILGGLKYRFANIVSVEAAVGAGLTRSWGVPQYQFVLGISYLGSPIQVPESWGKKEAVDETQTKSKDAVPVVEVKIVETLKPAEVPMPEPVVLDSDHDGISDAFDQCPIEKETINGISDDDGCLDKGDVKITITNGKLQMLGKVEFLQNRGVLTAPGISLMHQLALVLKVNPGVRLLVEVYVTEMPTAEENNRLSNQRAISIRQLLIKGGIERKRLSVRSLGMQRPIDPSIVEFSLQ